MTRVRVLVSECLRACPSWRHYSIVRDGGVTLVEMVPAAIAGWNIRAISEQGSEAWPDMTADAIVAWKVASHGADVRELDPDGAACIVAMLARHRAAVAS